MPNFRFFHAADIHLDSPLRGLRARHEGAAQLFSAASRKSFSNLVDAAIDADVAFVIIAGDLYDGDWKDYSTGQFFVRETARLIRASIRLFLVRGNHDAASEITRALPLPDGVHELSTRKIESVELSDLGVMVHGRSFAQRHVSENIAGDFPPARTGWFNIGILHTSLTGREGHDVYAPCSVDDLLRAGYQYWALGHIHAREVIHENPPIVFPGNLQGRHVRETGPKGATLVTVADQRVIGLEGLALDAARWETVKIDLDTCSDERSCHEAIRSAISPIVDACDGRPLCMRLRFTGRTVLHAGFSADREQFAEDIQAVAYGVSDQVFVERVILDTALPAAAPALSLPFADLEEAFETAAANPDFSEALKVHLSAIRDKAPREVLALLPEGGDGPPLKSVLASARDLILSRLAMAGATRERRHEVA